MKSESEFYEPYRDWDPFIAWNELKERVIKAYSEADRLSFQKKAIKESTKEN